MMLVIKIWLLMAFFNIVVLVGDLLKNPQDYKKEDNGVFVAMYVFSIVLSPIVFSCIVYSFINWVFRREHRK